jgi:hypothetical protein
MTDEGLRDDWESSERALHEPSRSALPLTLALSPLRAS